MLKGQSDPNLNKKNSSNMCVAEWIEASIWLGFCHPITKCAWLKLDQWQCEDTTLEAKGFNISYWYEMLST